MSPTRRDFVVAGAAAALGTVALRRLAFAGSVPQGQPAQPVFTPIRRNVGYFTMRGGTIGYLINAGGVAVVDSQFPAEATACLAGLNERSGARGVDLLINTHHHGDHSGGNISFRGVAKKVVAHAKAAEHMRMPPGAQPPADQLFPDTTFTDTWSADVGDERIVARHHGRAHTSGDATITFERANVVHMGDLMFNQRHPVVDRPAGAIMRGWMTVLDRTIAAHANDTIYIFGHANTGLAVTGDHTDLAKFRDYLGAVLAFADAQVKAGRSREEVLAMRDPLKGFESFGRFGQPGARDALTVAYEEVTMGPGA
ncbi:MAG: MBL fold metallo-hydrolase [Gemmatimonadales bacterium]|nr:MBL fold metallo-hydrolase [Gemmatimonadota bacterium]MCL4212982.1 MBL fold metallo-hydrolase [Gemmatimonadales bacterium]